MARVKRGFKARQRRNKVFDAAKGYRGARNNRYKTAIHVVRRAMAYQYRDRRRRKRDFRRLWVTRINAAARAGGLRYCDFMHGLKQRGIQLDRSVLADLAVNDEAAFQNLIQEAKQGLAS